MAAAKADEEAVLLKVVQFAAQNGHEFTIEELALVAASKRDEDLSDEQLDEVAGGRHMWVAGGNYFE